MVKNDLDNFTERSIYIYIYIYISEEEKKKEKEMMVWNDMTN